MAWSLDWFSASAEAKTGRYIRRAGWTDRWWVWRGVWWDVTEAESRVIRTTDYTRADLEARDWTTEAFDADPCAATPAFNSEPPVYRTWTSAPVFGPPPVPGFAEPP